MAHSIGVFSHDGLIDTNSGIMVDIARFCEPNNGVNEHVLQFGIVRQLILQIKPRIHIQLDVVEQRAR